MRGRWLRCNQRSSSQLLLPSQRIRALPKQLGRELKARELIPGSVAFTEVWIAAVADGGVGALRRFVEES